MELRFPNQEKANIWIKENGVIIQGGIDIFGVPIIIDKYLPENKAMIVYGNGEIKVFEI